MLADWVEYGTTTTKALQLQFKQGTATKAVIDGTQTNPLAAKAHGQMAPTARAAGAAGQQGKQGQQGQQRQQGQPAGGSAGHKAVAVAAAKPGTASSPQKVI